MYKSLQMSTDVKLRELKGRTIAGLKDSVSRIKENLYKVKSQTGNGQEYEVKLNEQIQPNSVK
jgi:hypothetical protein